MITALSLLLFALLVVCVVQIATSSDIGYVDPTICSWESVRLFALLWHATVSALGSYQDQIAYGANT